MHIKEIQIEFNSFKEFCKSFLGGEFSRIENFLVIIFISQTVVNFIGVLGPETGFDSLWYHLTLPKIYLLHHKLFYVPGGLLYYSTIPKLVDMLYVSALSFGGEIVAKIVHFLFGIGICFCLYDFVKKRFSVLTALLVVVVFYTNLVVGWESITAYIDLGRTFFEILALLAFIKYTEENNHIWFDISAVMIGLAISSKILAVYSLLIFLILTTVHLIKKRENFKNISISLIQYASLAIVVPLPWFLFSFSSTGNPIYPFFSILDAPQFVKLLNLQEFLRSMKDMFLYLADPISPVYLMFLPLVFIVWKKWDSSLKLICLYSLLGILFWYITPRTGGGRFILPYLPAFSLIIGFIYFNTQKDWIKKVVLLSVLMVSIVNLGYRMVANAKYVPVVIGIQSKREFLAKKLNFTYGDFYDTDGFFAKNIKKSDIVLLYGFHNLYYVNFPFIDSTFVKKGDRFNYIAVQNSSLPDRFSNWSLIYKNNVTKVKLYSQDGSKWIY